MAKKRPDEGTLPTTGGPVLDRAGIKDTGYIDKKGTPSGMEAKFNALPPGTNIGDQAVSDVSRTLSMPMKTVTDLGYPGDGW